MPLASISGESAELDDNQAAQLRNKLLLLNSWLVGTILGGTMFSVLALFVVGCLAFSSYQTARSEREQNKHPKRTAPTSARHGARHGRHGRRRRRLVGNCMNGKDHDDDDDGGDDGDESQDRPPDHETEPPIMSHKTTMIKPAQYYRSL